jgi:hypothetical protein
MRGARCQYREITIKGVVDHILEMTAAFASGAADTGRRSVPTKAVITAPIFFGRLLEVGFWIVATPLGLSNGAGEALPAPVGAPESVGGNLFGNVERWGFPSAMCGAAGVSWRRKAGRSAGGERRMNSW